MSDKKYSGSGAVRPCLGDVARRKSKAALNSLPLLTILQRVSPGKTQSTCSSSLCLMTVLRDGAKTCPLSGSSTPIFPAPPSMAAALAGLRAVNLISLRFSTRATPKPRRASMGRRSQAVSRITLSDLLQTPSNSPLPSLARQPMFRLWMTIPTSAPA